MPLTSFSASSLETADENTPFGCERKFHFQYVQGIRPPQEPSALLGEEVHATIERYLLNPSANALHPIALNGKHLIDPYLPRVSFVEQKFKGPITLAGLPVNGRIDLIASTPLADGETVDWKTTSNIARYAKTSGQVLASTQMNVYGKLFFERSPDARSMIGSFVYFQTKGKHSEKVSNVLSRQSVADKWGVLEKLAQKCIQISKETDIAQVKGDFEKCNVAKGCFFRDRCPRSVFSMFAPSQVPQKEGPPMSLLDRFALSAAPVVAAPPAPAPVQPPAPPPPPVMPAVMPPPPPAPPPAAVVMTHFEPVPPPRTPEEMAAKRGPGRPPGSRNKTKVTIQDFTLPGDAPEAAITAPATPSAKAEPPPPVAPRSHHVKPPSVQLPSSSVSERLDISITAITIRHGLTINMGNYQSAKVEVELTATGRGADLLREEVSKRVKEALEEEAKQYMAPKAEVKP